MSTPLTAWICATITACMMTSTAHAAIIDMKPINGYFDVSENSSSAHSGVAQSFRALDKHVSFGFYMFSYTQPENLFFSLISGDGLSGQILSTKTAKTPAFTTPISAKVVEVDFSSVDLIIGSLYTVKLTTDYGLPAGQNTFSKSKVLISGDDSKPSTYTDGRTYLVGLPAGWYSKYDLAFKVTGTSAVPEPSDWAMLIGGMASAGAILRRRRKHVVLQPS